MRALKATVRAGLGTQTVEATTYVTMHPLKGSGADSTRLWESWLEAFRWRDGQVVQARIPLATFLNPTVPTVEQLSADFPVAPVVGITHGVTSFSIVKSAGSRVDYDFVVRKDKEEVRWQRTLYLPNSSQ